MGCVLRYACGRGGNWCGCFRDRTRFGGDSLYYYLGDYTFEGAKVRGKVDVIHYSGPPMNIFGPVERITLVYEGQMNGDQMQAVGVDPTNSQRRVTMIFRRLANLP